MVNPYKSPGQSEKEETVHTSGLWPVYQRISASILTTIVAGYAIFQVWRLVGFETSLTTVEVRLWLLLGSGVLLLCFSSTSLRRKYLNFASVSRYVFGVAGTFILAGVSGIFVEMFMAWYSGVEIVPSPGLSRSLGNYVQLFWFNIFALSILPVSICLHGVARRRRIVVPALVLVCLVAAANLRLNFFVNHSDQVPSSWIQFFWL